MANTLTACVDGDVTDPSQAVISVMDEGLLRGDGVFEVIRVYSGKPFGLAAHLDRLERSAAAIDLAIDRSALEADAALALTEAGGSDSALRILCTRGGRRIVLIEELPAYSGPASLASVTHEVSPILEGVKSLSYAANMHATRIAKAKGADEALLVRADGTVLEAPTAAVFWAAGGRLHTPVLADGILASITRQAIVDAIEVEEGHYGLDDVLGADEAFIASTTREVQAVSAIDGRELPEVDGDCTRRAAQAVRAAVEAEIGS